MQLDGLEAEDDREYSDGWRAVGPASDWLLRARLSTNFFPLFSFLGNTGAPNESVNFLLCFRSRGTFKRSRLVYLGAVHLQMQTASSASGTMIATRIWLNEPNRNSGSPVLH